MSAQAITSVLLVVVVALPLVAAAVVALSGSRRLGAWLSALAALPAFALAAVGQTDVTVTLPWLVQNTALGLDEVGRVFLGFTSVLWFASGWYASMALADEDEQPRFHMFFLAAMAGNLGLIIAQDVSTFYACFALMGFASVGLVLHRNDAEAARAAKIYVALAVVGEALIVAGLAYMVATVGSTRIEVLRAADPMMAAVVCLLLGFGIKAGALSLHFWLPLAHPAAPVPASAVLSGAMIKAGLLGWIRFLPLGTAALPALGLSLVVAGMTASVLGAAAGVAQRNAKTVLAYSSISQMGIITVGVGIGLVSAQAWPAILASVLIYATHHALAKGALFLGLGPALAAEGRATRMVTWVGMLVPALALTGAPFTSGAIAKLALKSNLQFLPGTWPSWLGAILPVAAVGTTLLMLRFLWLLATAPAKPSATRGVAVPWAVLVGAVVVGVWLFPGSWDLVPTKLSPAKLWLATWPLLAGGSLALLPILLRRLGFLAPPVTIPPGDVVVLGELAVSRWPGLGLAERLASAYSWFAESIHRGGSGFVLRLRSILPALEDGLCRWQAAGAALAGLSIVLYLLLVLA